jgi:hypothetical protein
MNDGDAHEDAVGVRRLEQKVGRDRAGRIWPAEAVEGDGGGRGKGSAAVRSNAVPTTAQQHLMV